MQGISSLSGRTRFTGLRPEGAARGGGTRDASVKYRFCPVVAKRRTRLTSCHSFWVPPPLAAPPGLFYLFGRNKPARHQDFCLWLKCLVAYHNHALLRARHNRAVVAEKLVVGLGFITYKGKGGLSMNTQLGVPGMRAGCGQAAPGPDGRASRHDGAGKGSRRPGKLLSVRADARR